jgi:hypothetical protein
MVRVRIRVRVTVTVTVMIRVRVLPVRSEELIIQPINQSFIHAFNRSFNQSIHCPSALSWGGNDLHT